MTFFLVAVVVLLAVLVGVAVPALLQLRATLASAQSFLDTTGPQVERTLGEWTTAAERIQRVATEIEDGAGEAKEILRSTKEIVAQVGRVRDSIRTVTAIGAAVGPAIAAAARAFFARPEPTEAATRRSTTGEAAAAEETADAFGGERRS